MALSKVTQTAQGASASYWKVITVDVDKQRMKADIKLALFLNQAASASSAPFAVKSYSMPVSKAQLVGDIIQLAYLAIKAQAVSGSPKDKTLVGATDI